MTPPTNRMSTSEALRLILAWVLLWLAEVVWDLSDWLQGLSKRVEQPRRAPRGLVRLVVLATLAGMSLTAGLAWGLRGTEARPGVEAPPVQERHQTAAELLYVAVAACQASGSTWSQGIEDGVLVGRCYPIDRIGVVPVARKGAK